MANIAVLLPTMAMYEQAKALIERENFEVAVLKRIAIPEAVDEALRAAESGANIIVARGLQARLMKLNTNIPLVEIRLTGQELGLLVQRAKEFLGKADPQVAFVAFSNQYSSTEHFDKLYNVRHKTYFINMPDDVYGLVEQAKRDGADIIIGGESALIAAESVGLPALFHESTDESIREALYIAERTGYAMDIEKQSNAQLASIMDTSFNGIAKIDANRLITMVNLPMETLLGKTDGMLLGKQIEREIRGIDSEFIDKVLSGSEGKSLTSSFRFGRTAFMVVGAPIRYDEKITGAVFNFHKMKNMVRHEQDAPQEIKLHGYMNYHDFSHILRGCEPVRRCVRLAKMYALSKSPLVIYGWDAVENDILAGAIHNYGVRKGQPFVTFNCESHPQEDHAATLFGIPTHTGGVRGLYGESNHGTLLIRNIDQMSALCQSRLKDVIVPLPLFLSGLESALNVRLIVTAKRDLAFAVEEGLLSRELYYAVNGLSLTLPPLGEDRADVRRLAEELIKEYAESYSRFIVVTEAAYKMIAGYGWDGNLPQLMRFCERCVLASERRHIDEAFVGRQMEEMFPKIKAEERGLSIVVTRHPMAAKIEDALAAHNGNRAAVAALLGISKTTLWRQIKKYGVKVPAPVHAGSKCSKDRS